MDSLDSCIFCKIIKGEIPSSKLLENERFIVFMDIGPVNPGHTLIVPKAHMETIFDVTPGYGEELISLMQRVGKAIMTATGATGLNIMQNNYPDAGQAVPHVHWHLIPRFANDGFCHWKQGAYASMQEMQNLADTIKKIL